MNNRQRFTLAFQAGQIKAILEHMPAGALEIAIKEAEYAQDTINPLDELDKFVNHGQFVLFMKELAEFKKKTDPLNPFDYKKE